MDTPLHSSRSKQLIVPDDAIDRPYQTRKWVRYVISIGVCLVVSTLVGIKIYQIVDNLNYLNGPYEIDPIAYTEPVKAAVAQKTEASKGIFQTSLVLLGVLWGLILTKKDERKLVLGDWPELFLFVLANICFGVSFYCYFKYADNMGGILALGGSEITFQKPEDTVVMDFRDKHLAFFLYAQSALWVMAAIVTVTALFSAHMIKEQTTCPVPESQHS